MPNQYKKAIYSGTGGTGGRSIPLTTSTSATSHVTTGGVVNVYPNGDGTFNVYNTSTGSSDMNIDLTTLHTTLNMQFSPSPLTENESKKLDSLKEERDKWIKNEKLNNFKELPAHVRQDIVDEAFIKEFIEDIDMVNTDDFPDQKELENLEAKEANVYNQFTDKDIDKGGHYPMNFKYGRILDEFTREELMLAHTDATMEEAL